MTVKIVTDSTSDLPAQIAQELGITVVPVYVRFGEMVYRDGVDINTEQLYHKLAHGCVLPRTSTPSPGDFADAYNRLAAEADEILSIHLSAKYSGTYNAAKLAKEYVEGECRVEVIDSKSVSMGCGLVAITAARAAREGANLEQAMGVAYNAILHTRLLGMVSDVKYLLGGKRVFIPGAKIFLARMGTLVRAKLLGEVYEAGKIRGIGVCRSEATAFDRLERCLMELPRIEEMCLLWSNEPRWAHNFASRIPPTFPKEHLYITRLGCVTAMHAGPKALAIALIEG